ncbi:Uncharacterized protein SCF082_LOCUS49830 [Durusdinium trenchii]|uniref:Uncharacterized protein n=1 Tax=Durusdinium trenchii TaxID=1381693 RepID=A0ABP0S3V2_9DINO
MSFALMGRCALLAFLLFICSAADDSFFLPPRNGTKGRDIALILIQGAKSPVLGYKPVLEAIQKASEDRIWAGAPQHLLDIAEIQFAQKVDDMLKRMTEAGMKADRFVLMGHSLGAVGCQLYLTGSGHGKFDALILTGSTILRRYRNSSLPPTLTLDGDLDGLLRVSRQAEAYFHQVERAGAQETLDRPVVILEGLNHWSFSSGPLPSNVASHDLRAEVSTVEGHQLIGEVVSDYLAATLGGSVSGKSRMVQAVQRTGELLQPLLEALKMEGYRHLQPPCNSDYPTNPTCQYPKYPDKSLLPPAGPPRPLPPPDCTCGSQWVEGAAAMVAGLSNDVTLTLKDAFHDVSDVRPFHLPHIFHPTPGTACTKPEGCTINATTVTMPVYDLKDALDVGLWPITASELRSKFKSRQAMQEAAGMQDVNFTETDGSNPRICQSINRAAYEWALQKASPKVRARFQQHGQLLSFAEDLKSGFGLMGPTWIHDALSFTVSEDKKMVTVQSHYFPTPNKKLGDVPFIETVGYHYCKLLSPARAMEWIYVDSLKEFYGTKNATVTEILV